VRHQVVHMSTDNWWDYREEAIWLTDGLVNGHHLHPAIAKQEMHTGNWYSPMNIAGDLIFGGSHLRRDLMPVWRLSSSHLLGSRYMTNPFFHRDEVLSSSASDSERYLQGPSSDCFHLRQRYRRWVIHSPGSVASHCEVVYPGLSKGLLNLALGSLSEEQRIDSRFYNRFLVARHPRYFSDVPWQRTGRGFAESLPTRVWRSLNTRRRRLFRQRRKRIPSNQWFVDFPECVRKSNIQGKLLTADLMVDAVLGGAAKQALANHDSAPLSSEQLIAILTLETYLRQAAGRPSLMRS
jgi:hypothetical protein